MIAGLGFDYCWFRSRTKGLGKHPVLVSKQVVSTTTLLASHPSLQRSLKAFFFFATASFTSSFHSHELPPSCLTNFFLHNSSHAFKSPSLKDSHKFFAFTSTNSSTLLSYLSLITSSFNFHSLLLTTRFIFTTSFRFCLSTSTTTNLCCNSQGMVLISFRCFLCSFPIRTKSISVANFPALKVTFLLCFF